ncbi:MAG: hypothetical protein ACO1SV_21740 [Fimbriimonas sp.]
MQPSMDLEALTDVLVDLLLRCRKLGLANMQVDPEDPEVIEGYVVVLAANGIDADMVRAALPKLYAQEFFPKPGTIVTLCEPFKAKVLEGRGKDRMATLVECYNDLGEVTLAEPCRVRNGLLLPPGDTSGDGSAAKALPPRGADIESKPTGALVMLLGLLGNKPDQKAAVVAELKRRRKPGEVIVAEAVVTNDPNRFASALARIAETEEREPTRAEMVEADRAKQRIVAQYEADRRGRE